MKKHKKIDKNNKSSLAFLIIFGIAFGFVEGAVVYYLRTLINFHENYIFTNYKELLNLGFITFYSPSHEILFNNKVTVTEVFRESSTILMLFCIAFIAGKNLKQRFGAFLVAFACWDISYYIFLKILDNWPSGLMTKDIFFLIPVTWVGPVITPIVISSIMLVVGIKLYLKPKDKLILSD